MKPKETIAVRVLKRHFDLATKARSADDYDTCTDCLVAQAIQPRFPSATAVEVGVRLVDIDEGKKWHHYRLDEKGQDLISRFDHKIGDLRKALPLTIELTSMRKPKPIAVRVNKKHFDAAVEAASQGDVFISKTCIVAQAVKSLFPNKSVSVGGFSVGFSVAVGGTGKSYDLSEAGQKLIFDFDSLNLSVESKANTAFRAKLPLTIEMTRV